MAYRFTDDLMRADLGVSNEIVNTGGGFLFCWLKRGSTGDTADAPMAAGQDTAGSDWYFRTYTTNTNFGFTANNSSHQDVDPSTLNTDVWKPLMGYVVDNGGGDYDWYMVYDGTQSSASGTSANTTLRYIGIGAGVQTDSGLVAPLADGAVAHAVFGDFTPTQNEIDRLMAGERPDSVFKTRPSTDRYWYYPLTDSGDLADYGNQSGPSMVAVSGSPAYESDNPTVYTIDGHYFEDFSGETTGQQPSGWTQTTGFTGGTANVQTDAGAVGGKSLRFAATVTSEYNTLKWDLPSLDPDRDDFEILARVKGITQNNPAEQLCGRTTDDGTTRVYSVWSDEDGSYVRICEENNYTFSATGQMTHAAAGLDPDADWYYVRFRVVGTRAYKKWWTGTLADEPDDWTYTTEPRTVGTGGSGGYFAIGSWVNPTWDLDWIAIATGGKRARYGASNYTGEMLQQLVKVDQDGGLTFGSADGFVTPTAGNLLILLGSYSALGAPVPTDDGTGTWSEAVGSQNSSDNDDMGIWWKMAGGDETTITWNTSANSHASLVEIKSTQTSPVDQTASTTETNTTTKSAGTTSATTQADEIAVALVTNRSVSNSFGGWTNGFIDWGAAEGTFGITAFGSLLLTATGAQETTASFGVTGNSWGAIATFKISSFGITNVTDGVDSRFYEGQTGITVTGQGFLA